MSNVSGRVIDEQNGELIEARVQVLASSGQFVHPKGAILKVGPGSPFFYSNGTFEVDVVRGPTRIIVERGTEYAPTTMNVEAPKSGTLTVEVVMRRWSDLAQRGWHPDNTHIHYDEKESRPDERLQLDLE